MNEVITSKRTVARRPQRVLLLCDFFSSLGGTEYYNALLAQGLHDMGIDVRVYIGERPRHNYWIDILKTAGIKYYHPEEFHSDLESDEIEKEFINQNVAAINAWQPDVIHTHPFKKLAMTWIEHPIANSSIPIVATEWTIPSPQTEHWFDVRTKKHIDRVSVFVATCRALEQGIREYHKYTGRVTVIPHLLEWGDVLPSSPASSLSVGCISRLSAEKGLDFLIGAWVAVVAVHPDASLHIYGHGSDLEHLTVLCDSLGLKDVVHFEGVFEPFAGVDAVAARHAFFVQPSLFESIPTSLIELMMRDKAVVASDVGGISELIDASTGLLVEKANTEQLAAAINKLLADPSLTEELGKSAGMLAKERYDYQKCLTQLVAVYDTLL